jgi:ketosteroid isomerase-like protein
VTAKVEIVRRIYETWAHGDLPGPVDVFHDDIEYVNPAGAIEPGTRSGLAEFTRAVGKTFEAWEVWQAEIEQVEEADDRVAVLVRYYARGRGSGVEIAGRESGLFTFRDGKVIRYEWFHGERDAFEALARQ